MLKGISPIISPSLLKVLCEMGHGDEIVFGDANFPSESIGKNAIVVRLDGVGIGTLLNEVLKLIPLDAYVEKPFGLMKVEKENELVPHIWEDYFNTLDMYGWSKDNCEIMERSEFYNRAKKAYAVVATGEKATYANVILKKGVIN